MNSKVLVILGMTAAVLTTGCVQKVKMKILEPAEVGRMATAKKVAVTSFDRDWDVGLSQKIETLIAMKSIDGKPYFTAVDRTAIEKVLKEQKLQSSGALDGDTAVRVGKLTGAQALISGGITSNTSNDSQYYAARARFNFNTKRMEPYTVSCTKRVIGLGATVKITDMEKGVIIYADNMLKENVYEHCSDDSKPLPSKDAGVAKIADDLAGAFVYKLTPNYVYVDVDLIEKIEFDAQETQVKALESALNWISTNRYDKAQPILEQLDKELQGKSYAVIYNLGVIAEAQGRNEDAKALYAKADGMVTEPHAAINASIARIDATIAKRKKALEQMAR